jgi:hypothetical protein
MTAASVPRSGFSTVEAEGIAEQFAASKRMRENLVDVEVKK